MADEVRKSLQVHVALTSSTSNSEQNPVPSGSENGSPYLSVQYLVSCPASADDESSNRACLVTRLHIEIRGAADCRTRKRSQLCARQAAGHNESVEVPSKISFCHGAKIVLACQNGVDALR